MPSMANITVKNAANADVIYVARQASAGDSQPARWSPSVPSVAQQFVPRYQIKARPQSGGTHRRITCEVVFPVTAVINGVDTLIDVVPMTLEVRGSLKLNAAQMTEAVTQGVNLMAAQKTRDSLIEMFAPTGW